MFIVAYVYVLAEIPRSLTDYFKLIFSHVIFEGWAIRGLIRKCVVVLI